VCEQSLASYEGSPPPRRPRELARAALSMSADRACAASAYVGRLYGAGAGAKKRSGSRPAAAAAPCGTGWRTWRWATSTTRRSPLEPRLQRCHSVAGHGSRGRNRQYWAFIHVLHITIIKKFWLEEHAQTYLEKLENYFLNPRK
jgi:hypothetical protein